MSPTPSPASSLHLSQRPDFTSVRTLVSLVDQHVHRFLSDSAARKSLQMKCSTKLTIANHGYFEFSEHSVLSNLYWGIESIEVAIRSERCEERDRKLANSEQMLQIPASLEEEGGTAGISNRYLVCCSYFYLSLVRKLRGDQSQMMMHFLQCLLISPGWVRTELDPSFWESLFGSEDVRKSGELAEESARQQARRYKDWLMYYQVVSYGETPPWLNGCSVADASDRELTSHPNFTSKSQLDSVEEKQSSPLPHNAMIDYTLEVQESTKTGKNATAMASTSRIEIEERYQEPNDGSAFDNIEEAFDNRCLQDMLEDAQSETSVSYYSNIDSTGASDSEAKIHNQKNLAKMSPGSADFLISDIKDRNQVQNSPKCPGRCACEAAICPIHVEGDEIYAGFLSSRRSHSSLDKFRFSVLDWRDEDLHLFSRRYAEDRTPPKRSASRDFRCFSTFSSKFMRKYSLPELVTLGNIARRKLNFSNINKSWSEESSSYDKDIQIELLGRFEKAISTSCFSEAPGKYEDLGLEVTPVWEMLNNKAEGNCGLLKQEILGQLWSIISTSKNERVLRASVCMLLVLISEDKTVIEEIRKRDCYMCDLASALKRNVHEAAILIYLLNPSPSDLNKLELLPALVEVACNSSNNKGSLPLPLTPTSASIAMIEILVTRFDYVTNNMHLAAISSPQILSKLVDVAMNKKLEEGIALAAILVRCMRLNGNCRKFLSQVTPVEPFLLLLQNNEKQAKVAALDYFHEVLRIPRSSAICLLQQLRQQGQVSVMHTLMACMRQADQEHQLLAANLLFQLDVLERTSSKGVFKEEAMKVLLEAVASGENSSTQMLSASILSNLGGTYAWTGESYTAAWLVKRGGLASAYHKNMIRNIDWLDPCLQDKEMDAWSSKIARGLLKLGRTIFESLAKGVQSRIRIVSRDCLLSITWLGNEMAISGPSNLRYWACETLLDKITHFLHPGSELDERVLACLCVYNFTSGKGKQKLISFSEGLRESLRRLSSITWMAEELLRVTDFFLSTKPRVSCVHTQILEAGHASSGAVTALIFYKGHLCAGYSDGSIKVWDIKGQRAMLAWEVKEHRRVVTCFSLFEAGDSLVSGSSDKTVRVWQMAQQKLDCVEVIEMKDTVHKLNAHGDRILVITQSRGLKVCHASRSIQTVCKNKRAKCLAVAPGRIYLGCSDSSIQEVDLMEDRNTEIRAPASSWSMKNKSLHSLIMFKGSLYCAGSTIEGSNVKDWRRRNKPQILIPMASGTNVQLMEVVEDFIYLSCSSSPSTLQIWLRSKPQKVGRLSAGTKITSLLAANDVVFCGTESGLIKGWIPL